MRSRVNDQELYELAATLLSASADLNKFLGAKNLPPLSYATQYPSVSLSAENAPFHNAKGTIIEAAERIAELARGPRDQLVNLSFLVRLFLYLRPMRVAVCKLSCSHSRLGHAGQRHSRTSSRLT